MIHSRRDALIIGTGVALFPIHNLWLTQKLTTADGVTQLFLPSLGAALWILGSMWFCVDHWAEVRGLVRSMPKRLLFPLLVIMAAVALSGLPRTSDGFTGEMIAKLTPAAMSVFLASLVVSSAIIGREVFYPLAVGSAVASIGVIVHAVVFPGVVTGGFVFGSNYDIVVGYILLGAALYHGHWRSGLWSLSIVAILLTGSPEGVFALAVVLAFALFRSGNKLKLGLVVAPAVVVVAIWFTVGWGQPLYSYLGKVFIDAPTTPNNDGVLGSGNAISSPEDGRKAISYRLEQIRASMLTVTPLGRGYVLTAFFEGIVHNVPLILVQQLGYPGVLAALAWLWVSVRGVWRSGWKTAWVAVLALAVWDHYIWDQLAPLWWMLVGISLIEKIEEGEQTDDGDDGTGIQERGRALPAGAEERDGARLHPV